MIKKITKAESKLKEIREFCTENIDAIEIMQVQKILMGEVDNKNKLLAQIIKIIDRED